MFLWLGVSAVELSALCRKSVLSRSGLSYLPVIRRCVRKLSFGLACFQRPYIFHTSFWEFGLFLIEASLLSCCWESRTASALVVIVLKSQLSAIFRSAVRYLLYVSPGFWSRRLNLYIWNVMFLRSWQYWPKFDNTRFSANNNNNINNNVYRNTLVVYTLN